MASLAQINVKFVTDLAQFQSGMQKATSSIGKYSAKMRKAGKTLTASVTAPLTALAYKSVGLWDVQAKAIAQVEAGLKSTGGAVGFTSQQLQQMASDLQNNSLFGDEEILQGVTAQLLTFTNIAGDQFARTQQAALDLSTRLGGDLKGASIQLGKALNDPIANLSALSRSGIQFSSSQKAMIKSLVETNRLADAQTIILDELENQYGGSAAAAAEVGTGAFKQLQNSFGDLLEEFGKIITEFLNPLVDYLQQAVQWFQQLSPETKKWIVIIGGIAAAIGPILLLSGTILPALLAGFAALTGPIGLVIAGVVAIATAVVYNWSKIKSYIIGLANDFVDLYNESESFRILIRGIQAHFKNLFVVGREVFGGLADLIGGLARLFIGKFKLIFKSLDKVLKGDFRGAAETFFSGSFSLDNQFLSSLVNDATKRINNAFSSISDNVQEFQVNVRTKLNKEAFISDLEATGSEIVSGVTDLKNRIIDVSNGGASASGSSGASGSVSTNSSSGSQATGPVTALETQTAGVVLPELAPIVNAPDQINATLPTLDAGLLEWKAKLSKFNDEASNLATQFAENLAIGFAEGIGHVLTGAQTIGGLLSGILQSMAGFVVEYGKLTIKFAIAQIALKNSFSNPFSALAAGVALVAIGTALRNVFDKQFSGGGSVPALANGGIAFGETLALVGEYSNAKSNPEVIAPLNKLKDFIAPNVGFGGEVVFRQKGTELQGVLKRQNYINNKIV